MLSLTVVLTLLQPAQAKPDAPIPGFGLPADTKSYWPVHTLTREAVQKELKFTDEQVAAAAKLQDDLAKPLAAAEKLSAVALAKAHLDLAKKTDQAIDALLEAGQKRRFREVVWQVMEHAAGPLGMANNPVFAKALGLSDAQKRTAAKVAKDRDAALAAARKGTPGGGPGTTPIPAPMSPDEIKAKHDALLMKALTEAQKEKWDDLTGEPFLHKIDMPRGTAPFSPPVPKK